MRNSPPDGPVLLPEAPPREAGESWPEFRGILARVLAAQEEEKTSLGRQLHDRAGQVLTALQLTLRRVRDMELPERATAWREIDDLVRELGRELHEMAVDLRPARLETLGLSKALEDYLDDFAARTNLGFRHSLGRFAPGHFPRELELCVYRSFQDVVRWLRARGGRNVFVSLTQEDGRAVAEVGAELAEGMDANGEELGLTRDRLALMGGYITVRSTAPACVHVRIVAPGQPPVNSAPESGEGLTGSLPRSQNGISDAGRRKGASQ